MPYNSNHYRPVLSNTLYIRHRNSILISYPHLSRCELWLINSISTCQRSFNIFYLPIPSRRTRNVLRILHLSRNMKYWNHSAIRSYSNRIHRLCASMRTNILLRSNSNYKPIISYPLHWLYPSRMNLRWFLCRQGNPNTLLRIPLHPPIYHRRTCNRTSTLPSRNRIKQPHRARLQCR